jgi:hypothetical protein
MKKNIKYPLFIVLSAFISGCGEPLMDYEINTQMPIVEAYLPENANSLTVKVYSMEEYLKDEYRLSKPITGLDVKVNEETLAEASPGVYQLEMGTDTLREGQVYHLWFEYNGKSIEATTTIPGPVRNLHVEPEYLTLPSSSYFLDLSSDTAEVIISWDDPDNSYYQVCIESPNTSDMPSFGIYGKRMMQPFRGNTHHATVRDFRSAGAHWIYVYRVDKEYAELYERISSSDLANPVRFIQNAFGIYTAISFARVRVWASESNEE